MGFGVWRHRHETELGAWRGGIALLLRGEAHAPRDVSLARLPGPALALRGSALEGHAIGVPLFFSSNFFFRTLILSFVFDKFCLIVV